MGDDANHSISAHLESFIHRTLKPDDTILELGSGAGTLRLCEDYRVFSVEHDKKWLARSPATYIYAPIAPFRKPCADFPDDTGWYDRDVLRRELPHDYRLILVDGPPNFIGRGGFYKWRELFRFDVPVIIDDIHRERERKMIGLLSKELRRPYTVYAWERRHFGVILP